MLIYKYAIWNTIPCQRKEFLSILQTQFINQRLLNSSLNTLHLTLPFYFKRLNNRLKQDSSTQMCSSKFTIKSESDNDYNCKRLRLLSLHFTNKAFWPTQEQPSATVLLLLTNGFNQINHLPSINIAQSYHADMHFHPGEDLTYALYEQFKAINKRQWLFTVEPGQLLATYGAHVTKHLSQTRSLSSQR